MGLIVKRKEGAIAMTPWRRGSLTISSVAFIASLVVLLTQATTASAYLTDDRVAFDSENAIWTATANGGGDKIQVSAKGTSSLIRRPAVSPLGDEVAYNDLGNVYVVGMNGENVRAVYVSPKYPTLNELNSSPHWHPSGKSLIVSHDLAGSETSRDIATIGVYEGGLDLLISWPGEQKGAVYSSDGQKIAFSSNTSPSGTALKAFHLFIADADGTDPVQLTSSSGKTGLVGAYAPEFSPNGTRIAFEGQVAAKAGPVQDIYVIDANGENQKRLMSNEEVESEPEWFLNGAWIMYTRGGAPFEQYIIRPDGTGNSVYATNLGFAPKFRQASTMFTADERLAGQLRPELRFDSEGEHWRPQDVEYFFTHEELLQVCAGESCKSVDSTADLQEFPSDLYRLNVPGSGDADNFTSSDPGCVGELVWDCGAAPESSIYYHISEPSGLGYSYVDYWFFYRYNDSQGSFGQDHEADWESVSVAPSSSKAETFDFASFSQHGTWYSYLRDNLSCDGGSAGSCGTESARSGRRVQTFIAAGTHANYGEPCGSLCTQTNSATPETDHDGGLPWERNGESAALLVFPPTTEGPWYEGSAQWTDWPGIWGMDANVDSPGEQGHFSAPWDNGCADDDDCPEESAPSALRAASEESPSACSSWFGAGVAALACDAGALSKALRQQTLGAAGRVRVSLRGKQRASAAAPGLAQVMGSPLKDGDELTLSSQLPDDMTLRLRLRSHGELYEAVMPPGSLPAGRSRLEVERVSHSQGPSLVLPNGRSIEPRQIRAD